MFQAFFAWLESDLGHALFEEEQCLLASQLPHIFGFHALLFGSRGQSHLLSGSPIIHRVVCGASENDVDLVCEPSMLPIASESVDLIILPHILSFHARPHDVLREAYRILLPEGRLVVLGLNPLSWWGMRRMLMWRRTVPWSGQWLHPGRVSDWLRLLGFQVSSTQRYGGMLPFKGHRARARLDSLARVLTFFFPGMVVGYMMVACKREGTMTQVRARPWRPNKPVVVGLPEPASRG